MTRGSAARLLLVAPLLMAACATAGGGSASGASAVPDNPNAIAIEVRNNLSPRTAVTVRLLAGSGTRITLGGVPPGATRTLTISESVVETSYRLVAEATDGSGVTSQGFQLIQGAKVSWTLRTNALLVSVGGGPGR